MSEEVPVPGKVRCVNEKGVPGYFNAEDANNLHWQRSTGFKPKALPVAESLPQMTEPFAPAVAATVDDPQPKKPGRPAKNN